jgi:hypothetical protein
MGTAHLSDLKSERCGELKDSAFVNGTHLNHAAIVREGDHANHESTETTCSTEFG